VSDSAVGPLYRSRGVRSQEGSSPWFERLDRILDVFPSCDFTLGALTLTALTLGVRENMAIWDERWVSPSGANGGFNRWSSWQYPDPTRGCCSCTIKLCSGYQFMELLRLQLAV